MQRKFDTANEHTRQKCIQEVIARIGEIDGPVGVVAAEDIIGIVTQNYGPEIYNGAIADAKKLYEQRTADIATEFDLLEQS